MSEPVKDGTPKVRKYAKVRRTLVAEYVVEIEDAYPDNTEEQIAQEERELPTADVIDLLYSGDTILKQGAVSISFTDEEPKDWDGEEHVGHEPVFLVDWEINAEDPVVVQVEVTKVLGGDPSPDYLGRLLADSAGIDFNIAVAEAESTALQAVENAKDDELLSEEDEQAARLNVLKHIN